MDPINTTPDDVRPPSMNQEEFRAGVGPVVCCVETSEANRVAKRLAGFGLRDFLAAYAAEPAAGPLAFRSASRRVSLPGGLSVRFLAAGDMVSAPAAEDETKLAAAVSLRDDEQVDMTALLDSRADVALAFLCARRAAGAWTSRWRTTLEATLAHASHESFACPAAVVVVVASSEPAGVGAAVEELASMRHLAPGFADGRFDARVTPRHVVIVHDSEHGASVAQDALAAARNALSAAIAAAPAVTRLIALGGEEDVGGEEGACSDVPHDARFPRLTAADAGGLRRLAAELVHAVVVPALERRVAALHTNVAASRRGVRNVLKSWLRLPRDAGLQPHASAGAPATLAGPDMSPPQYPHETIEAQIRLLADTAFAVGDLETALAHYRLARDDFKRDRALLHAGAAHEMIARSLLGLAVRGSGGSIVVAATTSASGADTKAATSVLWRDAVTSADAAVATLLAAAGKARRTNAAGAHVRFEQRATCAARALTRAALVAADCRTAMAADGTQPPLASRRRMPKDGCREAHAAAAAAADALVAAAQFETNPCVAVLYERAAWCYMVGGLNRKGALHLVMAGHRYRACGADAHAVECYVAARAAYASLCRTASGCTASCGWPRIDEHIEHALGRQCGDCAIEGARATRAIAKRR